jgi:hypothetical protein
MSLHSHTWGSRDERKGKKEDYLRERSDNRELRKFKCLLPSSPGAGRAFLVTRRCNPFFRPAQQKEKEKQEHKHTSSILLLHKNSYFTGSLVLHASMRSGI